MKTVEEQRKEAAKHEKRHQIGEYTGVSCPKCKKEMTGNPYLALCSSPPQWKVKCECGYITYLHGPIDWSNTPHT